MPVFTSLERDHVKKTQQAEQDAVLQRSNLPLPSSRRPPGSRRHREDALRYIAIRSRNGLSEIRQRFAELLTYPCLTTDDPEGGGQI
jgi:hypothetical protein